MIPFSNLFTLLAIDAKIQTNYNYIFLIKVSTHYVKSPFSS
jgi:hypothetical protein